MKKTKIFIYMLLLVATPLLGQQRKLVWTTVRLSNGGLFHRSGTATFRFEQPFTKTPQCEIKTGDAKITVSGEEIKFSGPRNGTVVFECVGEINGTMTKLP